MAAEVNVWLLICRQVRRMGTGSPGSVWVLHLWRAESDPGPIARTTPGTDHVCSLRVLQEAEQAKCRARLGGQCAARTHRLDQGSAVAGLAVGWSGGVGVSCSGGGGAGR